MLLRRRPAGISALLLTIALTTAITACNGEEQRRRKADNLARAHKWDEAADIYIELGELEKAASALEEGMKYARAARTYEQAENWEKAAKMFEKAKLTTNAAEMLEKAGKFEHAGDLRDADSDLPAALEDYQRAEAWAKAGQVLERQGKFDEAAAAFEKGGDFSGIGRMLEKANKPIEAAAAYEKGKNFRAATALYETAEMWEDAARNATALAERDSGTDAKLQAARMLAKAGDSDGAAKYFDAALTQAKDFGNYAVVMDISIEAGKPGDGMTWLLEQAAARLDEGRPAVAAEALLILTDVPDAQWRKLGSSQRRQFEALAKRTLKAVEELPEITTIEGTNNFVSVNGGVQTFEFCQVEGAIRNNGDEPFALIEIEITLFKKDFDAFVAGQANWGDIPEELTAKFESEEAGYRETIEIRDLEPGETREFTRKLGNRVPYGSFSDYVITAEKS